MARCLTPFYKNDEVKGVNMALPCGRCPHCMKRRISNWSFRLMNEDKVSESSLFVTLTYDNDHIHVTDNGFMTLDKRDTQLFWKKLRKKSNGSLPIRYYLCGEYGGSTKRPHYHAIIFNANALVIQDAWEHGTIHVGEVNEASVGYTLKYMFKPRRIPLFERDDRIPEFSLMSKGLGKSYLTKAMISWHVEGFRLYCVIKDGVKIALPRYYRDKMFTEAQLEEAKELIAGLPVDELTQAYIDLQFQKLSKDAKRVKL